MIDEPPLAARPVAVFPYNFHRNADAWKTYGKFADSGLKRVVFPYSFHGNANMWKIYGNLAGWGLEEIVLATPQETYRKE